MTITVSPLANSQTMGTWYVRQNQLSQLMTSNVVTADATVNGSITTGNVAVNGGIGVIDLNANNLGGGTLATASNLYITTNTVFLSIDGLTTIFSATANTLTGPVLYVNSNTLVIANTTTITGNVHYSNTINVNNSISANSANIGGAINTNQSNLSATSTLGTNTMLVDSVYVYSNTKIGLTVYSNSNTAILGNTQASFGVQGTSNTSTGVYGLSTSGSGGVFRSNTGSPLLVANTTTTFQQTYANGSTYFANSLILNGTNPGILNSTSLTLSNGTITTVVNAGVIIVGANVTVNSSTLTIGNSTVNSTINASCISPGNSFLTSFGSNLVISNTDFVTSNAMMIANSITIGTNLVNTVINATSFSGTSANSILLNNHPEAYYANVTTPVITTTLTVGGPGTGAANGVVSNTSTIYIGNSLVNSTINSTMYSGTANNANNLGQIAAALYQLTGAPLTANVAKMIANNTTYVGTLLATSVANNSTPIISTSLTVGATSVVNTTCVTVSGNVNAYQLNLGGNAYITGNLIVTGTMVVTGTMSGSGSYIPTGNNLYTLGNSTFWFSNAYANTISTSAINFIGGGQVNSSNYTGTALNANTLNGQLPSYYANATLFTGNVNTPVGNVTLLNVTGTSNTNGIYSGPSASLPGQFIGVSGNYGVVLRNDGTNFNVIPTANATAGGYAPYGTYGTLRPFGFNLSTGLVTIDGTGVGTQFGGNIFGNLGTGTFGSYVLNTSGVIGYSNSASGLVGYANNGTGVSANSNTGVGIVTNSNYGIALTATANGVAAIQATSISGVGIYGISNSNAGVYGISNSNYGVYALSTSNFALWAVSNTGAAIQGNSNTNYGIIARSTSGSPFMAGNTSTNFVNVNNVGTLNANYNLNVGGDATFDGAVTIGGATAVTSTNYNTYVPTLTGTGATGSWNITSNNSSYFGGQLPAYYANVTSYAGAFNGTTITASGTATHNALTTANGIISTLGPTGYGQFVASFNGSSNAALLRNDGTDFSLLTALTPTTASATALRPFKFNLSTGAVSIDGTGVGTSFGGVVTVTGAGNFNGGFNGVHTTTNIGNTASQTIITLSSNAAWGNLPLGYHGLINVTSSYVPVSAQVGYFIKTGIRDTSGGWGGIYMNYDGTQAWWGSTLANTASPVWKNFLDSSNFNTYAPTLTGTGASGTWGINITGNAPTSTLATTATNALSLGGSAASSYAPLASPTFTGTVTIPTATVTGNESVTGTLGVTGTTSLTTLNVSGNEAVTGNLTVSGIMKGALMDVYTISAGGTYTLATSNLGQIIFVNTSGNVTIDVPALTAGGRVMITRFGTGTVTLVGTTASCYSRTGGLSVVNQYGSISLFYFATNTVVVDGNI